MDLGLKDKAAIVTGGASHIGQAIVFAFADEGARLVIIDKDVAQAELTASAAKDRGAPFAVVVGADLTDHAAAESACKSAIEKLGGIDILIANVGANWPEVLPGDAARDLGPSAASESRCGDVVCTDGAARDDRAAPWFYRRDCVDGGVR